MQAEDLKTYSTVALGIWNAVLTVALWLRKPGEEAGRAVHELREEHGRQLEEVRRHLAQVQTELEHMPTSEELARLEGTVKQIDARTEGLSQSMQGVRLQLGRIEDYLLNNKGG